MGPDGHAAAGRGTCRRDAARTGLEGRVLIFCHFAAEGDVMELAAAIKAVWAPLRAK